jgi:hypothetical protein
MQPRESVVRRCSFSGLLPLASDGSAISYMRRSSSFPDLGIAAPRVSFREHVQVTTIHPLSEIPREVRAKLWMSRDEMMVCIRNAAIEDMEEQLAKRDREVAEILRKETEETPRPSNHSDDSVVFECMETYAVGVF